MTNKITVTVPHSLGVEGAKARISERLEKLQRDYVEKIAHSQVSWAGDVANVRVDAFGQTATAQIIVLADMARVEIQLPWLLAALSGKVQQLVSHNASDALRIGHKTTNT